MPEESFEAKIVTKEVSETSVAAQGADADNPELASPTDAGSESDPAATQPPSFPTDQAPQPSSPDPSEQEQQPQQEKTIEQMREEIALELKLVMGKLGRLQINEQKAAKIFEIMSRLTVPEADPADGIQSGQQDRAEDNADAQEGQEGQEGKEGLRAVAEAVEAAAQNAEEATSKSAWMTETLVSLGLSDQQIAEFLTATGENSEITLLFELQKELMRIDPREGSLLELRGLVEKELTKKISERVDVAQPINEEMKKRIKKLNLPDKDKNALERMFGSVLYELEATGRKIAPGMSVDAFIRALLMGNEGYGGYEGYDDLQRQGKTVVGEREIDQAYPNAQECFLGVERIVAQYALKYSSGDILLKIKNKKEVFVKENDNEEKEFDFNQYKLWLLAEFQRILLINKDTFIQYIQNDLYEKGVTKVLVKDENGVVTEKPVKEAKELVLSKEAVERMINLADTSLAINY